MVFKRTSTFIVLVVTASAVLTLFYVAQTSYGFSHGIAGSTDKPGSFGGCGCHGAQPDPTTQVLFSTNATEFLVGETYTFVATVSNDQLISAGINVAAFAPTTNLNEGIELRKSNRELVHRTPKAMVNGSTSWEFTYTPGAAGWDTLYATGNAVNENSSVSGDAWNFAAKLPIDVKQSGKVRLRTDIADHFLLSSSLVREEVKVSYRILKPTELEFLLLSVAGDVVYRRVIPQASSTVSTVLSTREVSSGLYRLVVRSSGGLVFETKLAVLR